MRVPPLVNIFGFALAVAAAIEGVVVMAYAAPVRIEGIGGIMEQTVLLAGAQLFFIGILLMIAWILAWFLEQRGPGRKWLRIVWRLVPYAALILGLIVAVEGLIVAAYAGATVWEGIGGIRKLMVGAAGTQLFALGLLIALTWRYKDCRLEEIGYSRIAGLLLAVAVSAEGAFVVSIAGRTIVDGIGGILEQTIFYAGVQLLILGLIILFAWSILRPRMVYLNKYPKIVRIAPYLTIAASIAVAIEGVFLINHADRTIIQGVGGILAQTILVGGVQLFALGILQSFFLLVHKAQNDVVVRRLAFMSLIFLLLLVPAAFVL